MKKIISVSFLSANFLNLERDIEMLNQSDAEWFHLDVMDGRFVPNISFGMPVIQAISQKSKKVLDAHLMIVEPERYIEQFAQCGVDFLTVHAETSPHLMRTLQHIKDLGMKAGVALNPHTPISMVEEVVYLADMILLMSVNPGFGAQKFIPSAVDRVRRVRAMIDKAGADTLIQVDGGVTLDNAKTLFDAGANVLVTGSTVFSAENPSEMITNLLSL